jgi:hypothetical protein
MEIKDISTKDLQIELKRRDEEDKRRNEEECLKRQTITQYLITKDFIDAFAPNHGRTSCSDNYIINGFTSHDDHPRCIRCAMLEIYRGEYCIKESPWEISVDLVRNSIYE